MKSGSFLAFLSIAVSLLIGFQPAGSAGRSLTDLARADPALQIHIRTAAAKVTPAVVNIATTVAVREPGFSEEGLTFGLFPEPPRRQYGQGSGVIVSSGGLVITNNHVVAEAIDVEVLLADRRQFKGRVIATDPKTDVAVVKIEGHRLPFAAWGDSRKLAVGDFVLAIGNPMGLHETVTFGIISAVGRADVGIADYEDFIQTDAPINPGNSGGALVNLRGELVGINTAIASPTAGSVGVGFAIPSNMARSAMQSLLKTGRVVRGFLGASTQDITPRLRKFFKLLDVKGTIITDLLPKGPAERAELRRGDVVIRFDGKEIVDSGRLRNLVAGSPIGSRHRVEVLRNGKLERVDLVIQEAPVERARHVPRPVRLPTEGNPLGGLLVDDVTPTSARQLELTMTHGVVVMEVGEGSQAEASGLRPGDIVLEVNRQPVPDLEAYRRVVEPLRPDQPTLLLINRQGAVLYVPLESE